MSYKFCHRLKNALFFSNNDIIHCCSGEEQTSPKFMDNYYGEFFDKNLLYESKKSAQLRAKNGEVPFKACENCHSFTEEEWDDDLSIKDIAISHWTACNCNCFYCYTAKDKNYFNTRKPYKLMPVLEEIKDIIDFNGVVRFIGGDVAMLEEFEQIVNFFYDNGMRDFYVPTSGIKFLPTIEKILLGGYGHVIVSVDSGNAEMYRKIKQVDCFDKVAENISRYISAANEGGSLFELKYILIPNVNDNIEQVRSWLDFAEKMGAKNLALDFEASYLVQKPNEIPKSVVEMYNLIKNHCDENGLHYGQFMYLSQLLHGLENGRYKLAE